MSFKDELVYTNNTNSNDPMSKVAPGRVNSRHSITYTNPRTGKEQTQNYLDMNDIVVPIMIKKGDDGQIYFAMVNTYIPATKKIYLELPSIGMDEQKENYSDSDIFTSVIKLTNMLQLSQTNGNINTLSSNYDPVSQSFTNQTAKIVELGVKNEQGDKRLNWLPVSCLQDMLDRWDIPMSIQTKYALLLFAEKHKDEIAKLNPTKMDEIIPTNIVFGERDNDESIWPHKHRFGVAKEETSGIIQNLMGSGWIDYASENIEDNPNGVSKETSVYGMSKNSIQCVLTRTVNGKVQVGLMDQHRSPFITKKEINEVFTETPAGMIDEKDYIKAKYDDEAEKNTTAEEIVEEDYIAKLDEKAGKNAVVREVAEEAKIEIFPEWVTKISQDLLLSHGTEEYSKFYYVRLPANYKTLKEDQQDNEEAIGKLKWYDLDTLDIDELHAPIPTKIALFMAKNIIQREQILETKNDNER